MTTRRSFLKALACVPAAPVLLRGMSWAAPEPEVAAARGAGGYSCEVPPGTILPYASEGAPPGFLPCDGRAVPRFAYRRLHEAIGGAYGTAGRGLAFRVPDLRSRPAGALRAEARMAEQGWQAPSWLYVIRT